MKVIKRSTTEGNFYGIQGVDVDQNGRQLYPYDNLGEANLELQLLRKKQNPQSPKFKDPAYVSILKGLDRI